MIALQILGAYLLIGLVFAVPFVIRGCSVVDPAASGAGIRFRLMILPASMALWPLLMRRWALALKAS